MKQIRYFIEGLLLTIFLGLCKMLGVEAASNLGGFIGRNIGPKLAASRKALRNLEQALPEKTDEEYQTIIKGMWEHLGRLMAEYPHLKKIASAQYTELVDKGVLDELKSNNQGAIFFGGHLGNWEINASATFIQKGFEADITYRAPNNPYVDKLLMKCRQIGGKIEAYSKSREGGRNMLLALKNGHSIGILIDQKYNEGISAPFFNQQAMTNPVFVQMAQKFKLPLIPICNQRLHGAHSRLTLYPEIKVFDDNGEPLAVEDIIKTANLFLEERIKQAPEQWLWLHKRWG